MELNDLEEVGLFLAWILFSAVTVFQTKLLKEITRSKQRTEKESTRWKKKTENTMNKLHYLKEKHAFCYSKWSQQSITIYRRDYNLSKKTRITEFG